MPPKRKSNPHNIKYEECRVYFEANAGKFMKNGVKCTDMTSTEFDNLREEMKCLYDNYNYRVAKEQMAEIQGVIEESLDFFNLKIFKGTERIENSGTIVICHPYFDAVAGHVFYSKVKGAEPFQENYGLTYPNFWEEGEMSKLTGKPIKKSFLIGLNWKLLYRPMNELRDTLLHELVHAMFYLRDIDQTDASFDVYKYHTRAFSHQIGEMCEIYYQTTKKNLKFTNAGPAYSGFKGLGSLDIDFDPDEPKKHQHEIKVYFDKWDLMYEQAKSKKGKDKRRNAGKSAPKAKRHKK